MTRRFPKASGGARSRRDSARWVALQTRIVGEMQSEPTRHLSGLSDTPHRRFNPLNGRWVLVSPRRTARPWGGRVEPSPLPTRPRYDPQCYLCPGNERAHGGRNPDYGTTYAFDNDYPALLPDTPQVLHGADSLQEMRSAHGTCRVLCFSPRHDLDLALMSAPEIEGVVDLWVNQAAELASRYRSVLVFENRGEEVGASNSHPHGQLWASSHLPDEPAVEDQRQRAAHEETGEPLLIQYARLELDQGTRVVVETPDWLALVPFWAVWPFETLVMPRRQVARLQDLDDVERSSLAGILQRLLAKYDNLFRRFFPYSMGWHCAPGGGGPAHHWQVHAHFFPPLLRSATTRKFMAGYEMFAEAARDLTPEEAAERLRAQPEVHFLAGTARMGDG
jgi:UDPglucose--hexose-1-phosphate uridylyltransferase